MASLNIDSNTWYQITAASENVGANHQSLRGTNLYNDGISGAVFFAFTNTSDPTQRWQFFPVNSSTYILRCLGCGPEAYLAVKVGDSVKATALGDTVPYTASYRLAGDSMFWQTGLWQDGTVYLYNLANGSDWRLNVLDTSLMVMSSNITGQQTGEKFTYTSIAAINDQQWSTYMTKTTATIAQATGKTTTTPAADTDSTGLATNLTSDRSSALSTGAMAGIGIAVAIVVLAMLVLGIWCVRKHRRKSPFTYQAVEESRAGSGTDVFMHSIAAHEMSALGKTADGLGASLIMHEVGPQELSASRNIVEAPASFEHPVELPSDSFTKRRL